MPMLQQMFVFSIMATVSAAAANENWPQWRGLNGDSVAPGPLPTRWSKDKNIIWKTALPGWGNSTPAIWQDAIFVTTQQDDRILLLLRLDRRTGKIVWQREVGRGSPRRKGSVGEGRFHDEQNMASPSPVTDGKLVWAHFGNGDLACYDFAGKRIWGLNFKKELGPYSIWWGHANSPLIVGDLLISVCMQDPEGGGQSYVVAHDKRTGKQRWFAKRDTAAVKEPGDSYTTPLLYRHEGRTEVIVFGGNVLDAYDPASGKQLWHCHVFTGNRVISGPTLVAGTVYAVQGMRGPLFAVRAGGTGDVTASNVLWKYAAATPDAACPAVTNGLVFLATNGGVAVCIDAANGRELWKERLAEAFRASPLVADGKVYLFGKDGKATIVEASREFKVVSRPELDEEVMASPAAAQGDLFIRTKMHLFRIGSGEN